MGYLKGLKEYLDAEYAKSVFAQALESQAPWEVHLHGHRIVTARVVEDIIYEVKLDIEGQGEELLHKTQVKMLYPEETAAVIRKLIKDDKKVRALGLEPILPAGDRYHIKNKSLFPLMLAREVLFFTTLEGDVIRGILGGFSRYDITVNLKGGIPITLLRHAIYDLRDKKGTCFLRSVQETKREWERSDIFVEEAAS